MDDSSEKQPTFAGRQQLQVGQVIEDRYLIEALLGRGGMGAVFRAQDRKLGIPVAIKVILPELATPDVLQRFEREAQLVAQVDRQEGIVRVLTFGRHDPPTKKIRNPGGGAERRT